MNHLLIAVVISVYIFTPCLVGQVKADDLLVPEQYATISEAIKNAFPTDNIIIAAGTYEEHIILDIRVSILGAGANTTIITWAKNEVIFVSAPGPTTIQGITIDGKGAEVTGIHLENKSLASIKDIVITNVGKDGIVCNNESAPSINDIAITNIEGVGISYDNASSGNISNITITNTGGNGISCIEHSSPNINYVTITNTRGDGISCIEHSSPNINYATITHTGGNGLRTGSYSSPTLSDCIIKKAKSNGILISGGYSQPNIIRRCRIIENRMDGVYIGDYSANLGTSDDKGNNEIANNGGFEVNNRNHRTTISAVGNWWGQKNPPAQLFNGEVTIEPTLTETPLSEMPTIISISPNAGSIEGGTLVRITGAKFAEGAIVEIGGKKATSITVDSDTQITAVTPAGDFGLHDVVVRNPEGNSATLPASFAYVPIESEGIRNTEVSLTKGINIISLSLKPDTPWTAKTIAQELGATIVIRTVDSNFQAYVAENDIGEDFPIESNKGYIVNVTKPVNYTLLGTTWGEPAAAPLIKTENPTRAFVVTGVIQRQQSFHTPPIIAKITNLRTGESTTAKVKPNGRFIAAFVDFSRRSVVQAGDIIELSFIDRHGNLLSRIIRHIEPEQLERAYLNTTIELRPIRSALLPNYPNPFNPETWIPYQIAQNARVTIEIFNIAGKLIRCIELGNQTAGWYVTRDKATYWNGRNNDGERVASGIYFYQIQAGEFRATRRMLIMK